MTAIADPVAVFIDLQAYFCRTEHGYVDRQAETEIEVVVEAVNAFLERYRASGRTPVFVRTQHDEASNSPVWTEKYDRREREIPCRPGTPGAAFTPGLDVRDDDVVVTKHRYSAFYDSALETYLSANGATTLVVGGVATHVCVESAMRAAYDRDYDATVLADCTASADPAAKAAALDRIDGTFGAVAASEDVELEPLAAA